MLRKRRGVSVLGVACATAWLLGASAPADEAEGDPAALRRRLVEGWPRSGCVRVVVRNPAAPAGEGRYLAGYDFATGAWYYIDGDGEKILGRDAAGEVYVGKPNLGGVATTDEPDAEWKDSFLDPFFPGIYLRGALSRRECVRTMERTSDGWVVVFAFPRGLRDWRIERLPPEDVKRLGGPDAAHFEHRVALDDRMFVRTFEDVRAGRIQNFDAAPGGPPGFQVLTGQDGNMGGWILESLAWMPEGDAPSFDRGAVLACAVRERVAKRPVRTFAANPDGSVAGERPRGIGPEPSWSAGARWMPWVVVGVGFIAIGLFAWWRRRSGA